MFLVTEIYYEYNDEIMARTNTASGSEPGEPVMLYRTKEKAESAAVAKTLEKINEADSRYDSLSGYGYDADEVFNIDALDEFLSKNPILPHASYDHDDIEVVEEVFKNLLTNSDEATIPLIIKKVLRIRFFRVVEVGVED